MKKAIVYFSASGVTAKRAKELASVSDAMLYEVKPEVPYTEYDLDWRNKKSRSSVEMMDKSSRPAIVEDIPDLFGYDLVYIGFPIWWGVAPRVINTFIDKADLNGKKIYVFATSGGSGIDYALNDMKKTYPFLNIVGGSIVSGAIDKDLYK